MTAITLRNLPLELERMIRSRAKKDGLSLDGTIVRMLEELAGHKPGSKMPEAKDDLDALAGTWSSEEAAAFEEVLAEQRKIDPDLWR